MSQSQETLSADALSQALEANLLRQNLAMGIPATETEGEPHGEPQDSSSPTSGNFSRNIDDCIQELMKRPRSHLPKLIVPGGDTWVFIKPPARTSYQDADTYKSICDRYDKPIVASSRVLRESGSKLILKQLENPTQQYKIIRRFKVKSEMEGRSIKYVLDLTPPVEGEEAVEQTQELSCPDGILNWAFESDAFCVSDDLVGGVDEFSSSSDTQLADRSLPPSGLPDYSPLRHIAAIERVLLALHGENPRLNSAPKLYTTVMAAVKHLEIPAHCLGSLTDYVVTWLRAAPNCLFIERHPEITLKIADCLQVPALCQDVFSILVGEAALAMTCQFNEKLPGRTDKTIFSRQVESVDEIWETRIQYARNSFEQRLSQQCFQNVFSGEMNWVTQLPSVAKVPVLDNVQYRKTYAVWLDALKAFVKGTIHHLSAATYEVLPSLPSHDANSGAVRPSTEVKSLYNRLSYKQRIFTRFFWDSIMLVHFHDGWQRSPTNVWPSPGFAISQQQRSEEYMGLRAANFIPDITGRRIEVLTAKLLQALEEAADGTSKTNDRRDDDNDDLQSPRKRRRGKVSFLEIAPNLTMRPAWDASDSIGRTLSVRNEAYSSGVDTTTAPVDSRASSANGSSTDWWSNVSQAPAHESHSRGSDADDLGIFFRVKKFCDEVEEFLGGFARTMLRQQNENSLELKDIHTLLCLQDQETKYLPLWAGGMDDGSNGVFDSEVPVMPEGESFGPARDGLRHHFTPSEASFGGTSTSFPVSTVATSRLVNDGHSVIMDRRTVYAADEVESVKYGDSASNAGTDTTWEGINKDDASVSTSSDLVQEMTRTNFSITQNMTDNDRGTLSDPEMDDASFTLSDSDGEEMEFLDADANEPMSDFESIEQEAPSATQGGKSGRHFSAVREWEAANPAEAASVITYRERSKSPLVFEKS